ncbi:STAS domain-containing protein [candidate division KSB1 bacterium]|nr:STAS domain-containing protein [candidate division KSB1 bacterium]
MNIVEVKINDICQIALNGRFYVETAPLVEEKLMGVLKAGEKKVVIDFEKVVYISSSGLRVLLAFLKETEKVNAQCVLAGLQPAIQEIFNLSGFNELFKIYDTSEQAVKAF